MNETVDENTIVGLDIGTSKVVAIVGEINEDGDLDIVGIGSHRSRGLKKGTVVNIESTMESIQRAIEEAQRQAEQLKEGVVLSEHPPERLLDLCHAAAAASGAVGIQVHPTSQHGGHVDGRSRHWIVPTGLRRLGVDDRLELRHVPHPKHAATTTTR